MYFSQECSSSEKLLFQMKTFYDSTYFLKKVTFFEKLVLRDQLQSIYTSKDFPLTITYSFRCAMIWSDFETPQLFIDENSKQ